MKMLCFIGGRGSRLVLFPFVFLEIDFQDLHWSKTKKVECRMSECVCVLTDLGYLCVRVCVHVSWLIWGGCVFVGMCVLKSVCAVDKESSCLHAASSEQLYLCG